MYGTDDRCVDCGEHFADPHAPNCPMVCPCEHVDLGAENVEISFDETAYRIDGGPWLNHTAECIGE